MKTIIFLILSWMPCHVYGPPAEMSQQDIIKAWEFNYLMNPFTPARLKTALEIFVDHPDIAMAQARLESGDFTSNIWKENNNPFGMKLAKCRPTTAIGENRNHAKYRSWFEAVIDFKLWQEYWKEQGYDLDEMLTIYCPDPKYKSLVNNLL